MRGRALTWKWPNSVWSLNEDGLLNQWIGPDPRPSEADIVQAEAEYAAVAPAIEQRVNDLSTLRSAGKDIALVLTELVDWQLANTAMQATDFTPQVRQAYLDLKAIADRVKT